LSLPSPFYFSLLFIFTFNIIFPFFIF